MRCLMLSKDLMFSSQLTAPLTRRGHQGTVIPDASAVANHISGTDEYFVIVDLTVPGLDIGETIQTMRQHEPSPLRVLAIGPHVHAPKLEAAKEAGCDQVLTKGEASRALDSALASLGL